MFTEVTQLNYQKANGHEYIWNTGESSKCLLAGAILGSSVIRVRFIRGTQLDESRYQLAATGAGEATPGTLPYHSWMVAKGDEQWPNYFSEAEARTALEPYLQEIAISPTSMGLTRPLASADRISSLGARTCSIASRAH